MTPMTEDFPFNIDEQRGFCSCGSTTFFYSEMDPDGYFCTECGKPDFVTQAKLDREEPGNWSL